MFGALLETRNAAWVPVVVFIGTFLIALAIGRLLKRRAGVRLGLLFRLFCLTLAFYTAMWVYGVARSSWRIACRRRRRAVEHGLRRRVGQSLRLGFLFRKNGRRRSHIFFVKSSRASFFWSRFCSCCRTAITPSPG